METATKTPTQRGEFPLILEERVILEKRLRSKFLSAQLWLSGGKRPRSFDG